MTLDISKPHRMRDGRVVGVVTGPDGRHYGYVVNEDGSVEPDDWDADGTWWREARDERRAAKRDLVNV